MPFDPAIIDALANPKFNPPAIVEQLELMTVAVLSEEIVQSFERGFAANRASREHALAALADLIKDDTYKDDGLELRDFILMMEDRDNDIGRKLIQLEKDIKKAQRANPRRDKTLDERLLALAREDLDNRIDQTMFWRGIQARAFPTEISESFEDPAALSKALRAAIK